LRMRRRKMLQKISIWKIITMLNSRMTILFLARRNLLSKLKYLT
jgi:hypothetical protein